MPYIRANGVDLFYETAGDSNGSPILLISGLGVQMVSWPDHFLDPLVAAGHQVIRFDNRDIGLSTAFDGAPGDPQAIFDDLLAGKTPTVAYTLNDMAADCAALLDALDIDAAHVIGTSMGGMIAQTIALDYPDRVLSLTSIMSMTGAPGVGQPSAEAMVALMTPASSQVREDVIEHNLKNARVWASPGLFDEANLRAVFARAWDRVGGSQGPNTGRQFCAVLAAPPRDEGLASLTTPALVVHGTADKLIGVSGGQHTANCIPNSELLLVEGMGHDLPPAFAGIVTSAILKLVASNN